MASGNAGDLDVADVRRVPAQLLRQVALDDLRVIEVHLHLEIARADLVADRVCLRLRGEQIAGEVARIDRLDQDRHPLRSRFGACETQVAHVRARAPLAFGGVRALRHDSRHHVDARAMQPLRVLQRIRDRRGELVLAPRQRREPAIARSVVAGRRVDQHDLELVRLLLRDEFRDPELVGERELDGAKAGMRGLRKTLEERHLVEQERQVGGKARHLPAIGVIARTRSRACVPYDRSADCAPTARNGAISAPRIRPEPQ